MKNPEDNTCGPENAEQGSHKKSHRTGAELRKSEEKFRHLFERTEQGILVVRGDVVEFVNPAVERIIGYPADIITSKPFISFIHPDDRQTMADLHRRAMHGEFEEKRHHFRALCSDQTVKWLSIHGQIIDWEGAPANLSFLTDITESKIAEEQLMESEKRFSKAFRSSPAPQVISDIKTGKFIDVNDKWADMLGYSRQSFMGLTSKQMGIWADPAERDRLVEKLLEHGSFRDEPIKFKTSTGSIVDALWSAETINLDDRPVMLSMLYDMTSQKKMEDALRQSEQRLSLALDAVSDGVWDLRTDINQVYFSPRWYTMLGYEPYEMPQSYKTWQSLIHPDDLAKAENTVSRHLKLATPFEVEFRMKTKQGDYKWILDRGKTVEMDGSGNTLRMLGTHIDITRRKHAEQQLRESEEKYRKIAENVTDVVWTTDIDLNTTFVSPSVHKLLGQSPEEHMRIKMESVGRLAGGVAHDFNNMLSIINGYAELSIDLLDPVQPVYEYVREIHTAAKRSADIVRQLLAFARQQTINPVQLDLNDTIAGLLKMLQRLIGENIELCWHPAGNLWPVKIDPSQINQIMANLAVNARDAISDVGKIIIKTQNVIIDEQYCRLYSYFVAGRYVMISVNDNGCGMEKEVEDNLFEPFFTTKEKGRGTGLGLSTIYGIVKQNNGFINVYTEPGKGTTFKIYFPRHQNGQDKPRASVNSAARTPGGSETILIAEDEAAILDLTDSMLKRLGYIVLTARSPEDALKAAKKYKGNIDLLITDVIMPNMNGPDLAARLSADNPGLKTLFMSGYTADLIAHHGVLEKGVQFIEKPFSGQDLAIKVRKAIEGESL